MPFHALTENDLRTHCRAAIESLELWLRNLIDGEMRQSYGPQYVFAQRADGSYLLKADLRRTLSERLAKHPNRYSREIDPADLSDEIEIICNGELFKQHFREPLANAYPQGRDEALTFLRRLLSPRNKLSHANPISVREAEQVICYSHDIIESIKVFFAERNMQNEFNAPTIVRIADSLGNNYHSGELRRNETGAGGVITGSSLRPSERLSIEVEVDASFAAESYEIEWSVPGYQGPRLVGTRITIDIIPAFVRQSFSIQCFVTSHADWHRMGAFDDSVVVNYRVLPPLG